MLKTVRCWVYLRRGQSILARLPVAAWNVRQHLQSDVVWLCHLFHSLAPHFEAHSRGAMGTLLELFANRTSFSTQLTMSSNPNGLLRRAWLRWKTIRLPWRSRYLVGKKNTFLLTNACRIYLGTDSSQVLTCKATPFGNSVIPFLQSKVACAASLNIHPQCTIAMLQARSRPLGTNGYDIHATALHH
jgi:hypothetical protein